MCLRDITHTAVYSQQDSNTSNGFLSPHCTLASGWMHVLDVLQGTCSVVACVPQAGCVVLCGPTRPLSWIHCLSTTCRCHLGSMAHSTLTAAATAASTLHAPMLLHSSMQRHYSLLCTLGRL
jgi:hypothetical protein